MKPITDIIDAGTRVKAVTMAWGTGRVCSGYVAFAIDGRVHQRVAHNRRIAGEQVEYVTYQKRVYRLPLLIPLLPSAFNLETLHHE